LGESGKERRQIIEKHATEHSHYLTNKGSDKSINTNKTVFQASLNMLFLKEKICQGEKF
jgi:hypothetical protein